MLSGKGKNALQSFLERRDDLDGDGLGRTVTVTVTVMVRPGNE
jgi:hypothetical protein